MLTAIVVPGARIRDRESFHSVFAAMLGFPAFYGRNTDAFHDCLRSVALPESGMMSEAVEPGGSLRLAVDGAEEFRDRCPDLYAFLVDIVNSVNEEYERRGEPAPLVLVLEPA